jgi:hypothetical protein
MKFIPKLTGWGPGSFGFVLAMLSTLWLTGVALFVLGDDRVTVDTSTLMVWRHRATVWHALVAWCLAIGAGRFVWPHMALCLQRPLSLTRTSAAWSLVLSLGGLLLTGWGLLYGEATWHEGLVSTHFYLGAPLPVAMCAHWIKPLVRSRRSTPSANATTKNPSPPPPAAE